VLQSEILHEKLCLIPCYKVLIFSATALHEKSALQVGLCNTTVMNFIYQNKTIITLIIPNLINWFNSSIDIQRLCIKRKIFRKLGINSLLSHLVSSRLVLSSLLFWSLTHLCQPAYSLDSEKKLILRFIIQCTHICKQWLGIEM